MVSGGQQIIRIAAFVNIRCIFDALMRFVLFVKFVVVENNRNFSQIITERSTFASPRLYSALHLVLQSYLHPVAIAFFKTHVAFILTYGIMR